MKLKGGFEKAFWLKIQGLSGVQFKDHKGKTEERESNLENAFQISFMAPFSKRKVPFSCICREIIAWQSVRNRL